MTVLHALISDLLEKLDERELEMIFRSLLRSKGHSTIFKRTRHGPGEHGKDIVSLSDKDGVKKVNIFQLKTRRISINRWRTEIKPELEAMIQVPVSHPMISGTEPKLYFLVSTGDFSRDAAEEFDAYNKHNLKVGNPEVRLLNKDNLVNMFINSMASLSIFSLTFRHNLARIWLNIKCGKYDSEDWLDFVNGLLSVDKQTTDKTLLILGLSTTFLASQALSQGNFFISCDIFKIALAKMWAAIYQLTEDKIMIFDQVHEQYCEMIDNFVEVHKSDFTEKYGLYHDENGVIESILYPMRVFSLLGVLSYLAYFWGSTGREKDENELVELIADIIRNNPCITTPIADFLRKDIAITLLELSKNQKEGLAEKWIEKMLENMYQRYIRSGWWPSISDKPEDIIEDMFHFEQNRRGQPESFLIPILFRFCAKLGFRKIYDHYRPLFGDFRLLEYLPPDNIALAESELTHGVLEHGTIVEKDFPSDFEKYRIQVSRILLRDYVPIKKNRPYVLQLITDAYLDYVFPEIYLNVGQDCFS
mgnify:CR=1 FL=1